MEISNTTIYDIFLHQKEAHLLAGYKKKV